MDQKRISKIIMFFLFWTLLTPLFAQKGKPSWINQRPVDPGYYIGIGFASKQNNQKDYHKIATDNALSDMASQIRIQITSDVVQMVVEKAGMVEEDFKSYVRSSTRAELEGYELVDNWENDREYWVYYRLSKKKYERLKNEKLNKAKSLSLDMFKRAREQDRNGNVDKALLFYFQAIPPIEKYVNEPLDVEVDGQQLYLFNEIYSSLQRHLSALKLKAQTPELTGKLGKPLTSPLKVLATSGKAGAERPVKNLPVRFEFVRGSGELIKNAFTDARGIAKTRVLKITSTENLQIVKATVNLSKLINQENPSIILKGIINSLVVPSTRFMIKVSGLTAYIETTEINLGKKVEIKQLEPALKNILGSQGFTFSDSPSNVDFMIKVKATARKGAEVYGLFSSFVNLTFSVTDMHSGQEIYKNVLEDVKGIDLNYEKAGFKALSNAAKTINQKLIPDFLQKIQ
ncbi:MAG: hypothetical protein GXO77_16975 [Calditrichaeota bacterium]|nr:hypothetical protein [Calditrichota bacterium]